MQSKHSILEKHVTILKHRKHPSNDLVTDTDFLASYLIKMLTMPVPTFSWNAMFL